jgi:hypothetical protein
VLTAGQDGRDVSGELTVRPILTWFPDRDQDPDLFPPGDAVALATDSPYSPGTSACLKVRTPESP